MNSVDSKLNIGVVGLGKMGVMHACLLNTFPNVKVKALCDKSRLMRTIATRAFQDTVVVDDLEKFARLNLDAIYVLTPIPSHYPIIKQIYAGNIAKNVFVEKTLSSAYNRSEELNVAAEKSGGVNMVGYMKRFGVTFKQAKNLLAEGVLGDLVSFGGYAFSSDFTNLPQGSTASKMRGGVIEDLGSHIVDLALWLFGDLKVTGAKVNSQIAPDSDDDVSFEVVSANNLQGNFEVSWLKGGYRMPEFGLKIRGEKGVLSVNDDEVKLEVNEAAPKRWFRHDMNDQVGYFLGGTEYWRENQHFLDCINSCSATQSDFKSALKVDWLLDEVRRQCK